MPILISIHQDLTVVDVIELAIIVSTIVSVLSFVLRNFKGRTGIFFDRLYACTLALFIVLPIVVFAFYLPEPGTGDIYKGLYLFADAYVETSLKTGAWLVESWNVAPRDNLVLTLPLLQWFLIMGAGFTKNKRQRKRKRRKKYRDKQYELKLKRKVAGIPIPA